MQSAQLLKETGNSLLDRGREKEAVDFFSRAIGLDPLDAEAWCLRGLAWFRLMEVKKAEADFRKAIENNKDFHLAWFYLGEMYAHCAEFELARDSYTQALAMAPGNYHYQSHLAFALINSGDFEQAQATLQQMLNHFPGDNWALQNLAETCMRMKNYAGAITYYLLTTPEPGEKIAYHNNIGYSYCKTGDTANARQHLEQAIRLDPGFAYPYNNLGFVNMLEGNHEKAHLLINQSLELDPGNSYAYKNRALVYLAQNNTAAAITALEKAKTLGFDVLYGDEVDVLLAKLQTG